MFKRCTTRCKTALSQLVQICSCTTTTTIICTANAISHNVTHVHAELTQLARICSCATTATILCTTLATHAALPHQVNMFLLCLHSYSPEVNHLRMQVKHDVERRLHFFGKKQFLHKFHFSFALLLDSYPRIILPAEKGLKRCLLATQVRNL